MINAAGQAWQGLGPKLASILVELTSLMDTSL